MNETASKNYSATGALGHFLGVMAVTGAIEYGLCYLAANILSDTLFHGRLDQPAAAVGIWMVGILARYFVKPRTPKQPPVQQFQVPASSLPPDFLDLLTRSVKDPSPSRLTPYL